MGDAAKKIESIPALSMGAIRGLRSLARCHSSDLGGIAGADRKTLLDRGFAMKPRWNTFYAITDAGRAYLSGLDDGIRLESGDGACASEALSPTQFMTLRDIRDFDDPYHGMQRTDARNEIVPTLGALRRMGYIDQHDFITEPGRARLADVERIRKLAGVVS